MTTPTHSDSDAEASDTEALVANVQVNTPSTSTLIRQILETAAPVGAGKFAAILPFTLAAPSNLLKPV